LKPSPKQTFGRTEAVLMLRVSSSPNRYQALIFVKRRSREAAGNYGCTEFYGLA
jgi:hypothetical protein